MTAEDRALILEQTLLRRVLASGDARRIHIRFRAEVVDRYRELPGAQLIRTRTVGRVAIPSKWSLDMGIVDGDSTPPSGAEVHVPLGDLIDRLPEDERAHWIEHLVAQPASEAYLQMTMAAGACIDDGETEPWESA
jgi:hypothetical protein